MRRAILSVLAFQAGKNSAGFTLAEVLVAIVILSVGFLGLSAMTISTIRGLSFSKDLTTATVLAQEKMEEIRHASYAKVSQTNYPLEDYNTISGYPQFRRVVTISSSQIPNTKTAVVSTNWKDIRNFSHHITLQTIISP